MSTVEILSNSPSPVSPFGDAKRQQDERVLQLVYAFNDAVYRADTERVRMIMNELPSSAFWRKVSTSYNNYSPLHYAASTGNADLALTLIDAGFAVDVLDAQRRTPLMWAANEGHDHVVLELLEQVSPWPDREYVIEGGWLVLEEPT